MGAQALDHHDSRAIDTPSGPAPEADTHAGVRGTRRIPPRRRGRGVLVQRRTIVAVVLAAMVLTPLTAALPPAAAHGKKGTKKYCKHHVKKCKRNVKSPVGHTKITYKLKTKKQTKTWSFTAGDDLTATGSSEQQAGDKCLNTGEGEYWVCNGGVPRKKGSAELHSISWAKGNLFNNTFYRLHHRTTWRWKKKRIKKLSEGWWPEVVSWYWKDAGKTNATLGRPWYDIFDGMARSGHRRHVGWRMESCMLGFAVCVQFHPYVRHYVHGDGTFHASGHNW